MFRSGASRGIIRSLNSSSTSTFRVAGSPARQQLQSKLCTAARRPHLAMTLKLLTPTALRVARWASSNERAPVDKVDKKTEEKVAHKVIKPTPETVSSSSTTSSSVNANTNVVAAEEAEPDMMAGIKADLQTIRETFSLEAVPRQAYYMGMAGVLPYAATAASTVFCAFEIGHAAEHGTGYILDEKTAENLLHLIEPIQVGYGAVILSFLGAIHWGLEWAKYGGEIGYPRYAIGVVSTAVAWPTIFMPVEYALITQFLAFNFLYYTDVRAKTRGWTPQWYGVYRFVLTFIVGASIVVSLIGRGQIADRVGKPPGVADRIRAFGAGDQSSQIEEEESARRKFLAEKDEDDEEEEEDEE